MMTTGQILRLISWSAGTKKINDAKRRVKYDFRKG